MGGAAAIPFGALSALVFLRDMGKIQGGRKVLVNGASGAVGVYSVQLAKHFGADVTGVSSTANLDLVKSLGADGVIDYTQEDFTKSGETYDIIFDTVGTISFSRCKDSLTEKGRHLFLVFGLREILQMLWTSMAGSRKVVIGVAADTKKDLLVIKDLLDAGSIKPVIDGRYPLEQTAEAHRYVDKGHKKGAVVIMVEHSNQG